jgi:hypothetical protein
MTELADLLELLHGAQFPFVTLRARVRTWHHDERNRAAFVAAARRSGGGMASGRPAEAAAAAVVDVPVESDDTVEIWRAGDRTRFQASGRYGVRNGERWWLWDERTGAISNAGAPRTRTGVHQEFAALLDPTRLLGVLRFAPLGPGRRAGRAVLRASAVPRPDVRTLLFSRPLHEIGLGADRYVFDVDAQRGVILRVVAEYRGDPFLRIEVLEIAFDEELDDGLFVFVPPPGEQIHPPRLFIPPPGEQIHPS